MEPKETTESPSLIALISAPGLALILGVILIYSTSTSWGFAPIGVGYSILYGAVTGIMLYILLTGLSKLPIPKSFGDILAQLQPIFKNMNIAQILILSLMAGIGEEVFFRGFLQTWLSGFIGIELAILIGAIGFGLLHFASIGYFVITTMIGLALGTAYYLTGSLLLVMVWHSVYDVIAIWVISRHPEWLDIKS
jgi:membrane protease YdiL (CAAX protease family)